ncbi:predicted protein [Naegleria gruberi]|uniref:Predicted protein n=1 Tax=Naegleria gruberi TaxID=5762 RepID=D2VHZ3_NAEGR|nr:uncharacterized protein NAEGRDRAFT_58267 [Naegleria gruberi]EFC43502.1 predicted protein [Naegleria gruberi]|eukprot:XP_002676246.1 predicted protein [Naegleria gruberi strain NEG-M]
MNVLGSRQTIVFNDDDTTWELFVDTDNILKLKLYDDSVIVSQYSVSTYPFYLALVKSSSQGLKLVANTTDVYINSTFTSKFNKRQNQTQSSTIGMSIRGDSYLNGLVDNVAIAFFDYQDYHLKKGFYSAVGCHGDKNPTVCNNRGICIGESLCECKDGYSGDKCENTTCFGIGSNTSEVCSGHGQCDGLNNCTCDFGYSGSNCAIKDTIFESIIATYGESFSLRNIFDNKYMLGAEVRGLDAMYNLKDYQSASDNKGCLRATLASGNTNSPYIILYNNFQVTVRVLFFTLDGNQTLLDLNNIAGWKLSTNGNDLIFETKQGSLKSKTIILGLSLILPNHLYEFQITKSSERGLTISIDSNVIFNDTTITEDLVTNTKGESYVGDLALEGYIELLWFSYNMTEEISSLWYCNGIRYDSPIVCSGKGLCLGRDLCECVYSEGNNCQVPFCHNVSATNVSVCSGHGDCHSTDECKCDLSFTGLECQINNAILYVHNENGTAVDSVDPQAFFIHNNLSVINETGAYNPIEFPNGFVKPDTVVDQTVQECLSSVAPSAACKQLILDAHITANTTYNITVCEEGYYQDPNVTYRCKPMCFGVKQEDHNVCSGHGSCKYKNFCLCYSGFHGHNCQIDSNYTNAAYEELSTCGQETYSMGFAISSQTNTSLHQLAANDKSMLDSNVPCALTRRTVNDFAISFKIYLTSIDNTVKHIISINNLANWFLYLQGTKLYINGTQTNLVQEQTLLTPMIETLDKWYKILVVKSSSLGTRVYLDGKSTPDYIFEHYDDYISVNESQNTYSSVGFSPSHGYIDELMIFGVYGMQESEITNIAAIGGAFKCNGIHMNSTKVCNGNGVCNGFDVCICNSNYSGLSCSLPMCFNIVSNDAGVCSGHGVCIKPNICECNVGFVGSKCQTELIKSTCTDPEGNCASNNATNYIASKGLNFTSSSPDCKNSQDIYACGQTMLVGSPVFSNVSICREGYYGSNCSLPICFGVKSEDPLVCNGNGNCTKPDFCKCFESSISGQNCGNNATFLQELYTIQQLLKANDTNYSFRLKLSSDFMFTTADKKYLQELGGNMTIQINNLVLNNNSISFRNGTEVIMHTKTNITPLYLFTNDYYISFKLIIEEFTDYNPIMNITSGASFSIYLIGTTLVFEGHTIELSPFIISVHGEVEVENQIYSILITKSTSTGTQVFVNGVLRYSTPFSYDFVVTLPQQNADSFIGFDIKEGHKISLNGYIDDIQIGSNLGLSSVEVANLLRENKGHFCAGIYLTSPQVCNSNGKCYGNNVCECNRNFTGSNCDIPVCFGISADCSQVCSGNGHCEKPGFCACKVGYAGEQCQTDLSATTCTDVNGDCFANDPTKYFRTRKYINEYDCSNPQTDTEIYLCGGKSVALPLLPGNPCPRGYYGSNCSLPICFGVKSEDPLVCNGNGNCTKPDYCRCYNSTFSRRDCGVDNEYIKELIKIQYNMRTEYPDYSFRLKVSPTFVKNTTYPSSGSQKFSTRRKLLAVDTDTAVLEELGGSLKITVVDIVVSNGTISFENGSGLIISTYNTISPLYTYTNDFYISFKIVVTEFKDYNPIMNITSGACFSIYLMGTTLAIEGLTVEFPYPIVQLVPNGIEFTNIEYSVLIMKSFEDGTQVYINGHEEYNSVFSYSFLTSLSNKTANSYVGIDFKDGNKITFSGTIDDIQMSKIGSNNYSQILAIVNDQLAYSCNGIYLTSPKACNSNGKCYGNDLCECNGIYIGKYCDIPVCFTVPATLPNVCSGNGYCEKPNQCSCKVGFIGTQCQTDLSMTTCMDPEGNCTTINTPLDLEIDCTNPTGDNLYLCSKKNATGLLNVTTCREGYYGSNCSLPICFGVKSEDPLVCSGNGNCIKPDFCKCFNSTFTRLDCGVNIELLQNITNLQNELKQNLTSFRLVIDPLYISEPDIDGNMYIEELGSEMKVLVKNLVIDQDNIISFKDGTQIILNTNNVISILYLFTNNFYVSFSISPTEFKSYNPIMNIQSGASFNIYLTGTTLVIKASILDSPLPYIISVPNEIELIGQVYDVFIMKSKSMGTQVYINNKRCYNSVFSYDYIDTLNQNRDSYIGFDILDDGSTIGFSGTLDLIEIALNDNLPPIEDPQYPPKNDKSFTCANISMTSPKVCSGNGKCVGYDNCICNVTYIGSICNIPVCFNIPATFSKVCSGNGYCEKPNQCSCKVGFIGTQCQTNVSMATCTNPEGKCNNTKINGTLDLEIDCTNPTGDNLYLCSKKNATGLLNVTTCREGYYGSNCSLPICFGVKSEDPLVCSGNGNCTKPDFCKCFRNSITGQNCQNDANYPENEVMRITEIPNLTLNNFTYYNFTYENTTSGNYTYTNLTISNFTNSNFTSDNITIGNYTYTNSTSSNFTNTNLTSDNITIGNFTNSNFTSDNITIGNFTYTNLTIRNLTSDNITISNFTISNFTSNNITIGNFTYNNYTNSRGNFTFDNVTSSNFTNNNLTANNLTKTNLPDSSNNTIPYIRFMLHKAYLDETGNLVELRNSTTVQISGLSVDSASYIVPKLAKMDIPTSKLFVPFINDFVIYIDLTIDSFEAISPILFVSDVAAFNIYLLDRVLFIEGNTKELIKPEVISIPYVIEVEHVPYSILITKSSISGTSVVVNNKEVFTSVFSRDYKNTMAGKDMGARIGYNFVDGKESHFMGQIRKIVVASTPQSPTDILDRAFTCDGTFLLEPSVCNGHGKCYGLDVCSCNSNYTGSKCSTPVCFGIASDDKRVCSGKGLCEAPDTCACNPGFIGANCSIDVTNTLCKGNPNCTLDDPSNYLNKTNNGTIEVGIDCNNTKTTAEAMFCGLSTNPTAKPSVVNTTVNTCKVGYYGTNCKYPICFKVQSQDKNVCSGKGTCTKPDFCKCKVGYSGNNCQVDNSYIEKIKTTQTTTLEENPYYRLVYTPHSKFISYNTSLVVNSNLTHSFDINAPMYGILLDLAYHVNLMVENPSFDNNGYLQFGKSSVIFDILEDPSPLTLFSDDFSLSFDIRLQSLGGIQPIISLKDGGYWKVFLDGSSLVIQGISETSLSPITLTVEDAIPYTGLLYHVNVVKSYVTTVLVNGNPLGLFGGVPEFLALNPSLTSESFVGYDLVNDLPIYLNGTLESLILIRIDPINYSGVDTSLFTCFGISQLESSVCSHNGVCFGGNVCVCNGNYTGEECQTPLCFGVSAEDEKTVCSGKGYCSAPDKCECKTPYVGSNCQVDSSKTTCNTTDGVCTTDNASDFFSSTNSTPTLSCAPFCNLLSTLPKLSISSVSLRDGDRIVFALADQPIGYPKAILEDKVVIDRDSLFQMIINNATITNNKGAIFNGENSYFTPYLNSPFNIKTEFSFTIVLSFDNTSTQAQPIVSSNFFLEKTPLNSIRYIGYLNSNKSEIETVETDNNVVPSDNSVVVVTLVKSKQRGVTIYINGLPSVRLSSTTSLVAVTETYFGFNNVNSTSLNGFFKFIALVAGGFSDKQAIQDFADYTTCYGISTLSSDVCSGHGVCVYTDNCECKKGYVADDCSLVATSQVYDFNNLTTQGYSTFIRGHLVQETDSLKSKYCNEELECENCITTNGLNSNRSGIYFDGSSSKIDIAHDSNMVFFHNDFTVTLWLKKEKKDGNSSQTVIYMGSPSYWQLVATESIDGFTLSLTDQYTTRSVSNLLKYNRYYFVSVTKDSTSNGLSVCFNNEFSTCFVDTDTTYSWRRTIDIHIMSAIGYNPSTRESYFMGSISNLRFDAAVLSSLTINSTISIENSPQSLQSRYDQEGPVCFGIPFSSDNNVQCSFKKKDEGGKCIEYNKCDCFSDYYGEYCQDFTCNNIMNTNSTFVCNGHGTCHNKNNCTCEDLWTDLYCSKPKCHNETYDVACSKHGECTNNHTCLCKTGYTGEKCEYHFCNNILNTDLIKVCSAHGKCDSLDNCICNPTNATDPNLKKDWIGTWCEIPRCFGAYANDTAKVCSNHGACIDVDTCVCTSPYFGDDCKLSAKEPMYKTIIFNSSIYVEGKYVFGNGSDNDIVAVAYDNTTDGYGTEVTTSSNISLSIRQADVLGKLGVYQPFDRWFSNNFTVSLTFKMNGSPSKTHTLFNFACGADWKLVYKNNTLILSFNLSDGLESHINIPHTFENNIHTVAVSKSTNHGTSLFVDGTRKLVNSTLLDDWRIRNTVFNKGKQNTIGSEPGVSDAKLDGSLYSLEFSLGEALPDIFLVLCNGKRGNDTTVCSGFGVCEFESTCSCDNEHDGSDCEFHKCFNISSNSSSTCHSHGHCVAVNVCNCTSQYSGPECQYPVCHGIPSDKQTVCSSSGLCSEPDVCVCNDGYYGSNCEVPICYGLLSNQSGVCSNNGECISHDTCSCNSTFTGSVCSIPMCFGLNSSDIRVCSSKGVCVAPDTCICNNNTDGVDCSIITCGGLRLTHPDVCGRIGECIAPDVCEYYHCFGVESNETDVCSSRGKCIGNNTCECETNYFGNNCQNWTCIVNNITDCSNRGSCDYANHCVCEEGHVGNACEVSICFNILSNDSNVCSGHGLCVDKDTCVCDPIYDGESCSLPICFGFDSTQTEVCSGRGICGSPNNCTCEVGYFAPDCSLTNCYGVVSNTSTVCGRIGKCIAPDVCEYYHCFGVESNETDVCSSRGKCIGNNTCECETNYFGNNCQNWTCIVNNITDCSNRGSCDYANHCTCSNGYIGSACEVSNCFDILSNDSTVCYGHGICNDTDLCLCISTYVGKDCSIPICYGFNASDSQNVCTGRGICSLPDTCQCSEGFTGPKCEFTICYNIPANETNVCNGHGNCTYPDNCKCNGYIGTNCSTPVCYGLPATDPNVCAKKGTCNDFDTCNWYTCYGLSVNNSQVCSGRGACISNNNCKCSEGYTGEECQYVICYEKYGKDACNRGYCAAPNNCTCDYGFEGIECNITSYFDCANRNNCSAHGTCISQDVCVCRPDYRGENCSIPVCFNKTLADACSTHGVCVFPNVCSCEQEFTGKNCEYFDSSKSCSNITVNSVSVTSKSVDIIVMDVACSNLVVISSQKLSELGLPSSPIKSTTPTIFDGTYYFTVINYDDFSVLIYTQMDIVDSISNWKYLSSLTEADQIDKIFIMDSVLYGITINTNNFTVTTIEFYESLSARDISGNSIIKTTLYDNKRLYNHTFNRETVKDLNIVVDNTTSIVFTASNRYTLTPTLIFFDARVRIISTVEFPNKDAVSNARALISATEASDYSEWSSQDYKDWKATLSYTIKDSNGDAICNSNSFILPITYPQFIEKFSHNYTLRLESSVTCTQILNKPTINIETDLYNIVAACKVQKCVAHATLLPNMESSNITTILAGAISGAVAIILIVTVLVFVVAGIWYYRRKKMRSSKYSVYDYAHNRDDLQDAMNDLFDKMNSSDDQMSSSTATTTNVMPEFDDDDADPNVMVNSYAVWN